ncbi:helix-turn-helix domain-containing protein [Oscillatoriales cyanobacterium LEGE 11467]|uniref:Helix-turn-helix domain-containing protein n=1 Tax=Zarconia navalis LEGE 11467 TaxID=1828826 RepID=A0A928W062_9CYAN|nr:helix-turn-helix domain-containing protein [Zarconia navalis]MBE9040880.1 helix-turn-helix domain-containing protein [Zarconia navalis LEGE 11467]
MTASKNRDYTPELRQLMQKSGVSSFLALSVKAGVSEHQVRSLRRGQVSQMRLENLLKLARALDLSLEGLLATFSNIELNPKAASLEHLQVEYDRLQGQLDTQRAEAIEEFKEASLNTLESWMFYWPSAAYAARQDPEFSATTFLTLIKPVEQLLHQWGVETIGEVGMETSYNPQEHQLLKDSDRTEPGQTVTVCSIGYRIGARLLHRVKVKPTQS